MVVDDNTAKSPQQPIHGKGTILVVDDEDIVRILAEAMLQKLGYAVLLASDSASALDFYREHWQTIDLVILDLIMPNMGGLECLQQMRRLNPSLKALISSGYLPDTANHTSEKLTYGFLHKPYGLQELSAIVAATLSA